MKFVFTKSFKKSYKQLPANKKVQVDKVLLLFSKDPFKKSLRNHKLKGKLHKLRSISVSYDLRIIFIAENGYVLVTFLDVGTHAKVY
jgi:addiction module RelE/StbE family toxin